jgi:two-component system, OmpR family, response regulator
MNDIKVLLVDDERDFLETMVKRLEKRKFLIRGAENGTSALELIEQQPFDVVVLDVMMPGLDGIETLREIKKNKPLIEVIMLTGHASLESGIEGMKLGAFDYILKPTNIEDLVKKIYQAYEKKTAHEEKIRNASGEDFSG